MRVVLSVDQIAWVQRARDGDEEAFSLLVEAYQVPVYNLCHRMLGDPAEAEDAAQETFLRAFRGLKRYDPDRPFGTWLLAIASHYCIDHLRRRRIVPLSLETLLPSQESADPAPRPEDQAGRQERRAVLRDLTHSLGSQDRAAIVLRYWYDMSYEEIGQALSLSVGAVKSRLHRARKELAEHWMARETPAVKMAEVNRGPSTI